MNAPATRAGRHHPVGRGVFAFLWNSNPFYPISAALVLLGLRASCDPSSKVFPTWATLCGLAAYSSLLSGMAILLVRRMKAWEDVRTIVLLVAMVLFMSPAFFDDVLARDPGLGVSCEIVGLLFAIATFELILRGLALRMPWGFRIPFHLSLALFYLHPAAMSPWLRSPNDPAVAWGLFLFPLLAAGIALSLIPAARRGPSYVAKDGTPWRWPLYPWCLFVFIALGVCARSATHCLSVNYSGGTNGYEGPNATIFGLYFLIPFVLAVAAVLLEIGRASHNRVTMRVALVTPIIVVGIAAIGHRPDPVYQRFLHQFIEAVGTTPMFAALVLATAFYGIAASRRVRGAVNLMTISVIAMSFIGPETLDFTGLTAPQSSPLVAACLIQGCLALTRQSIGRGLAALACLAIATAVGPILDWSLSVRVAAATYVAIAGLMFLGAIRDDRLARILRAIAAVGLAIACTAPLWAARTLESFQIFTILPIATALIYAKLIGDRTYYLAAGFALICWSARYGGFAYAALRKLVPGLDQITLGLAFFVVAALISLAKAGALESVLRRQKPDPTRLATDPAS